MDRVLILDFGSQYTQLIARRIREMQVGCEIHPCTMPFTAIRDFCARALILSGGPASVLKRGAPGLDARVFELGIPILGICYGMQLMTKMLGGKVVSAKAREYGQALLQVVTPHALFEHIEGEARVWMSHGDSITKLPDGFELIARTLGGVQAAIAHTVKPVMALQFHPEVHHTVKGTQILWNFLFGIAKLKPEWNMHDFMTQECARIRETVGGDRVILGLSGGVDSSVAGVLIHRAIANQLTCIFINNGLLRQQEEKTVRQVFKKHFKMRLIYIDASREFLRALKGVADPERKRKIIGRVFIAVFTRAAAKIKNAKFLAQGTLYPDVIESVSCKGPSAVIKSHHNVGGLPKKMGLRLLEPLRELFKDEVRELGRRLEMPAEIIDRHPFPGPGLGIRILGNITPERLNLLKRADVIVTDEIRAAGLYNKVWQAFAVFLPVRSVGVMGDERTYENTCCVRVVESVDGMTADFSELPKALLTRISGRIINEVRGINRVVYDISSKPPATIEWE